MLLNQPRLELEPFLLHYFHTPSFQSLFYHFLILTVAHRRPSPGIYNVNRLSRLFLLVLSSRTLAVIVTDTWQHHRLLGSFTPQTG